MQLYQLNYSSELDFFYQECYHVVLAGGNNLAELVELKFDHIFFIGTFEW